MDKESLTASVKDKALELGFDMTGIASARSLGENGKVLAEWCSAGMNAGMGYLSRDIAKRITPEILLPGTRSVIVTGMSYYTEEKQGGNGVPMLSRYAYGENYHDVILSKLRILIEYLKSLNPGTEARAFVDSAPVLEKPLASLAGLGWQGKHSIVINRHIGSFFFIGTVYTNLELVYDAPENDRCGTCTLCIDSCPTNAINGNRTINANKCISYITIERKEPVSQAEAPGLHGRIFGCDICQEVCPWNKKATPHNHAEFNLNEEIRKMTSQDWLNLTSDKFRQLFRRSPIGRRKYDTFMQNVTNVTKSINH
jgi:epoxyqueuosine reductase